METTLLVISRLLTRACTVVALSEPIFTFMILTIAPHQPRLDWQMWFAALGSYQNNPWLVHLVYRLLIGQREGENDEFIFICAWC